MHSSFYREPVKEICRAIFYRDLRTGNLQELTWHFFFQRPPWMNTVGWGCCCLASLGPLMILGWFWVLSTFPFRNFGILPFYRDNYAPAKQHHIDTSHNFSYRDMDGLVDWSSLVFAHPDFCTNLCHQITCTFPYILRWWNSLMFSYCFSSSNLYGIPTCRGRRCRSASSLLATCATSLDDVVTDSDA